MSNIICNALKGTFELKLMKNGCCLHCQHGKQDNDDHNKRNISAIKKYMQVSRVLLYSGEILYSDS